MMTLGSATRISTAAPAAFFACWGDMAGWPEWNADTEWVRLDGPFAAGSTGVLKPKGGPKTKFVITELTDTVFTDVSLLMGARLTFHHTVAPTAEGGTEVAVTVTLAGPLARLWNVILGKGIAASLGRDLAALVRTAEGERGAEGAVAA
ncbi:SRPBCC family protein [Streptacidiphilus jiangxiensis]|uniref:Polyketide cyclase / dehydrase and lipid transport n=1 Tax=Streptacidiphilus jiangxiensis TaxID=235985 RepID=A0A1H7Y8M1_STRJI|nr:SRPBCC family protein [Streptacidiphilus jiangxiensis]SEM42566.1 Polyketide cyclase / dehydrase and lipid transport [Streptacidiphilus jiangxiensis]